MVSILYIMYKKYGIHNYTLYLCIPTLKILDSSKSVCKNSSWMEGIRHGHCPGMTPLESFRREIARWGGIRGTGCQPEDG